MGVARQCQAAVCLCVTCFGALCRSARAEEGATAGDPTSTWPAAIAARQAFEAEPAGSHTQLAYTHIMDGFRAIYHGNPRDAHAARAAEQVAELLAEQGREFHDRKSLRDAAGQYIYVAHAYTGGSRAQSALAHAADLLGPKAADDPAAARAVAEELATDYPQETTPANSALAASPADTAASISQASHRAPAADPPPTSVLGHASHPASPQVHPVSLAASAAAHEQPVTDTHLPSITAAASVTGIRHWSTSSYTRVVIDLGGEVEYQAARVENPDSIFFDLHHAHLNPELQGKSFTVTDDGFLTRIRAAQYTSDTTRVVLDVHQVTEYSAFLLPNPYRLIIDIHGKQEEGGRKQEAAIDNGAENREQGTANNEGTGSREQGIAVKAATLPAAHTINTAGTSSLPPMPVTDGSASFGLPMKSARAGTAGAVAEPRVVISSRSTAAKPVPNSVAVLSETSGAEIAAVSRQGGKVEATDRPTSSPIVAKSTTTPTSIKDSAASASGAHAESEITEIAKGDHYRKPTHSASAAPAASAPASANSSRLTATASPVQPAPPTSDGETLMRALGLKIGRIVIDAGHGGHDSGTLGAGGIEEKDVVLDVALRLGKLLHDRLGAEIVYTRADDTFIPLETRTAIANKAQADLFISVHANSSPDATARGVEVYYLNFTSDPDAMRVAARENAVSNQSVHELSDLVKKIALKDKIDESRELATDVDQSLYAGLAKGNDGLHDRGVKKAPFVVLIGANMPSILAEISFVTNTIDAEELGRPAYRERVAESIFAGVARYSGAINGSKPKIGATERAQRE